MEGSFLFVQCFAVSPHFVGDRWLGPPAPGRKYSLGAWARGGSGFIPGTWSATGAARARAGAPSGAPCPLSLTCDEVIFAMALVKCG